ncbi:hypothetical protein NQ317_013653 [Molorchus minor]|uniref:Uncharacterized protein n=1 Tax=Molorchus minor TaxID=1323400 RepID=A0ABQ9JWP2_9CUCU|nr:hypothetical protein NQ317_013653 [Molorchus minor]
MAACEYLATSIYFYIMIILLIQLIIVVSYGIGLNMYLPGDSNSTLTIGNSETVGDSELVIVIYITSCESLLLGARSSIIACRSLLPDKSKYRYNQAYMKSSLNGWQSLKVKMTNINLENFRGENEKNYFWDLLISCCWDYYATLPPINQLCIFYRFRDSNGECRIEQCSMEWRNVQWNVQ